MYMYIHAGVSLYVYTCSSVGLESDSSQNFLVDGDAAAAVQRRIRAAADAAALPARHGDPVDSNAIGASIIVDILVPLLT